VNLARAALLVKTTLPLRRVSKPKRCQAASSLKGFVKVQILSALGGDKLRSAELHVHLGPSGMKRSEFLTAASAQGLIRKDGQTKNE
jgi:hypothetical protein